MSDKSYYNKLKSLKDNGFELITTFDEYYNVDSHPSQCKITYEDKDGYRYYSDANDIIRKRNSIPNPFNPHNKYAFDNIKHFLKINNKQFELIDGQEYSGRDSFLKFKCHKCGGIFNSVISNIIRLGYGCKICSGQQFDSNINSIYGNNPELLKYFKNKDDALNNPKTSPNKFLLVCPNCHKEKYISGLNLLLNGFNCACSSGKSINERIFYWILIISNIEFEQEYSPIWANGKRYDFKIGNKIFELNGALHYKETSVKSLEKTQEVDNLKRKLCENNGLEFIDVKIVNDGYIELYEMFCDLLISKNIIAEEFKIMNKDRVILNSINEDVAEIIRLKLNGVKLKNICDFVGVSYPKMQKINKAIENVVLNK
jgi:hypothetical protein